MQHVNTTCSAKNHCKCFEEIGNKLTLLESTPVSVCNFIIGNELTLLESTPVSVCNFLAFSMKALVGISPSCGQERNALQHEKTCLQGIVSLKSSLRHQLVKYMTTIYRE